MSGRILITGANGQLGTVLSHELSKKHGVQNVVVSDINPQTNTPFIFEKVNVCESCELNAVIVKYQITQIYHLAAILSADGESDPLRSWKVNVEGWLNVLEAARKHNIQKLFFPSTIGVFGPSSAKVDTPNNSFLDPLTVYGVSKSACELWSNYYAMKYGLDIRSIRYQGVMSYQSIPEGGTTDYAVEMFYYAIKEKPYICYLEKNTRLPMIYIDDAIRATLEIMDVPIEKINVKSSYNISGLSSDPEMITAKLRAHIPSFQIRYQPDFRQQIAAQWPISIDDSQARKDWGRKPKYCLDEIVALMIEGFRAAFNEK